MKIHTAFNESNITRHACAEGCFTLNERGDDNKDCPRRKEPWWMKQGLSQTASGYGRKLNTGRMIHFNGRWHRVYSMCYGNSGSAYFVSKGRTIFV